MGYISVTIKLTTYGEDVGPFDLYTNADDYTTPIVIDVTLAELVAGYVCNIIPEEATIIKVQSKGTCTNYILLPILGLPLPSQTPTPTPTHTPTNTPTSSVTPSPSPSNSPSPNTYTVYFSEEVLVETELVKRIKSYVYTEPPLAYGDSFKLSYTNYAHTWANEDPSMAMHAKAERKIDGSSEYWDRAYVSLTYIGNISQTTNGFVIITPSNINDVYFYVEADIHIGDEEKDLLATARSTITSVETETGGATYVIGLIDEIEAQAPNIL